MQMICHQLGNASVRGASFKRSLICLGMFCLAVTGTRAQDSGEDAAILRNFLSFAAGERDRAMIIRSSPLEPGKQANLEEDLAIMSHLLNKTVEESVQVRNRKTMGVDALFGLGSPPVHSFYLEGYGALFLIDVDFPLIRPPVQTQQDKDQGTSSPNWEEARREVYGRPSMPGVSGAQGQPYNDEKVRKLQDALLQAVRNAANIRGLTRDDWITVVVTGERGDGAEASDSRPETSRSEAESAAPVSSSGQTVMTIRVKKSDVDAFAKGKLGIKDFRSRAVIASYAGG